MSEEVPKPEKVKFKQFVSAEFHEMLVFLTKIGVPMKKSLEVSRFMDSYKKECEFYNEEIKKINASFDDEREAAKGSDEKMSELNKKLMEKFSELQNCESEIGSIDFEHYKDHPKLKEETPPLLLHMLKPIFKNFPAS
jgi:uncharacterized coiled-coil DUF342 family protein